MGPAGTGDAAAPDDESGRGEAAAALGDGDGTLVNGGGSIDDVEMALDCCITGSGRAGISSSAEDVSIVMCFVGGGESRSV